MRIKTTWERTTYDVWGNADDGYDVNDMYRGGIVEFPCSVQTHNAGTPHEFQSAYPSDYALRRVFGVSCALDTDGDDTTIYVRRHSDGYPLGELFCTSHSSLSPICAKVGR